MKRLYVLFLVTVIFSSLSNAQSFDGVRIDGSLSSKIQQYRAKGYVLNEMLPNGAIMKGKVAGNTVELFILTTPKTKVVYKMIVYLPVHTNWPDIKSEYAKFVDMFTEKHGEPDSEFDFFRSPYYEGDGYEMSAITLDKVVCSAFWINRNNLTFSVSISKYKQVEITYENDKNMEIAKREASEINLQSF